MWSREIKKIAPPQQNILKFYKTTVMIGYIGIIAVVLTLVYVFYWRNRRIIPDFGGVVISGASSGIGEYVFT